MYNVINNVMMGLNKVGGVFYDYAAGVFIQSALLVILLFVIDLLLRKRVRAVFRYCVWLLVLLKLVLPPMLSLPTGIGYWVGDHIPVAPGASNMAFDAVVFEHAGPPGEMSHLRPSENITGHDPVMASADSALTPLAWQAVVFLLWLAGVLAFLAVLVQRIRFVKGLVTASSPAGDELTGLLEQCRRQMAVRRDIKLRLSEAVPSPAVCGLFRPTVLTPVSLVEKLSPEGLRATLIHELAHIKRGDLWVNSVQTFLQVVYFYNPFVWFANSIIRKVCEEAVDETVLVALGGQAKNYSNTLIDISEMAFWKADLGLRLIGVAESKKALQWRIRHMLNRPIPKSSKLGALGIIMLLVIAAVLLPMARAEKAAKATKPVTAKNKEEPAKSLQQAATDGDLEQVKKLISEGADVSAATAKTGRQPLADAASNEAYLKLTDEMRNIVDRNQKNFDSMRWIHGTIKIISTNSFYNDKGSRVAEEIVEFWYDGSHSRTDLLESKFIGKETDPLLLKYESTGGTAHISPRAIGYTEIKSIESKMKYLPSIPRIFIIPQKEEDRRNIKPPFQFVYYQTVEGDTLKEDALRLAKLDQYFTVKNETADGDDCLLLEHYNVEYDITTKFWVVPSKGYCIKKMQLVQKGIVREGYTTTLKEYLPGIWWFDSVKAIRLGGPEGINPDKNVELSVKSLILNEPIDPKTFTLAGTNIPHGTQVQDDISGLRYVYGAEE